MGIKPELDELREALDIPKYMTRLRELVERAPMKIPGMEISTADATPVVQTDPPPDSYWGVVKNLFTPIPPLEPVVKDSDLPDILDFGDKNWDPSAVATAAISPTPVLKEETNMHDLNNQPQDPIENNEVIKGTVGLEEIAPDDQTLTMGERLKEAMKQYPEGEFFKPTDGPEDLGDVRILAPTYEQGLELRKGMIGAEMAMAADSAERHIVAEASKKEDKLYTNANFVQRCQAIAANRTRQANLLQAAEDNDLLIDGMSPLSYAETGDMLFKQLEISSGQLMEQERMFYFSNMKEQHEQLMQAILQHGRVLNQRAENLKQAIRKKRSAEKL